MLVDGVEALRRMAASEEVSAYAAREVRPGAEVEPSATFARPSAASSIRSARARSARWSTATGGCGCEGLSVADASIMPSIPRANTNLSTIALAERLAERMLA